MRKGTAVVALALLVIGACGPREHDDGKHEPRAVCPAVSTWGGSEQLKQAKGTVVAACSGRASDDRVALVLAILMAETNNGQACERDAGKDSMGDAANYSAFNVNKSFLKSVGWVEGQGPDLNDQANLAAATGWVLKGMEQQGEDHFLNFHRGGSTGAADGVSYGCGEYRATMRAVQQELLKDKSKFTSAHRLGAYIPHV